MAHAKRLQQLHGRDTQRQADSIFHGWCGRAVRIRSVGVDGELDEKTEREWRHDLENRIQQGAKASEPELKLERFEERPEERILVAIFDPSLERFLYFVCQWFNSSIWVDVPYISLRERTFVPCLYMCA